MIKEPENAIATALSIIWRTRGAGGAPRVFLRCCVARELVFGFDSETFTKVELSSADNDFASPRRQN